MNDEAFTKNKDFIIKMIKYFFAFVRLYSGTNYFYNKHKRIYNKVRHYKRGHVQHNNITDVCEYYIKFNWTQIIIVLAFSQIAQ